MIGLEPVAPLSIPKFPLGEIVITLGAATRVERNALKSALHRHLCGDWGELDLEDWRLNDERMQSGGTIISIYKDSRGVKFYIITEADRSVTTILLPAEY
jgi:hypothetical protein